ncbi:type II secretion system F family protein [Neptunomonas sp. XY-337]|uniref:type II secretion system F family protein n=1 Tax=Neptunomonas sp. XY-337 TaxID=2561897 RepID=UPI0010AA2809|nr:type II secretion system F family protein [Neptunomonas sp. XY-337]
MATFKYKALDQQGREIKGSIEAESQNEASAKLRGQSVYVLSLKRAGFGINPFRWLLTLLSLLKPGRYTSPKAGDKVIFFRQLALMLRSGNTLTQGLEISSEMTEKRTLQRAIIDMLVRIQSGSSFAAAVEAQGRMFPPVANRLIASAEMTGELQLTLERLADNLERSAAVKRQLMSSLAYPIVLVLVSVGVFLGLTLNIIPKFATMLEGKSQELPAISQAMLDVSAWMVDYGAMTGSIFLGVIFVALVFYTTRPGKAVIDRLLLNVPLIGSSIRISGMAQMGWTMSMLLGSGLTVLESLRVMKAITGNMRLAECYEKAGSDILAGRSLAFGLQQRPIPVMVQHMTGIGERSGELEHVMTELGKYYQQLTATRIKAMTAAIQPVMTIVVGGMVAFVYIGFFRAMFAVSAG